MKGEDIGSFKLNYINVPLLLGYKPTKNLSLFLGPEAGLLMKVVGIYDGQKLIFSDVYKKFDIGLDLGIAYTVISRVGVELRYNYGIKRFSEYTYTDENGNSIGPIKDGLHRGLQVGLFYLFARIK